LYPKHAAKYAIKDGMVLLKKGQFPKDKQIALTVGQGEKNAQRIMELIQGGATRNEIIQELPMFYLRYSTAIEKLLVHAQMKHQAQLPYDSIDLQAKNYYIYGDSGTGKTFLARFLGGKFPMFKLQNKWWDGYSEENTSIIFNDLSPMAWSWWTLLDAADQYVFVGEIKNGTTFVNPRNIPVFVTSNYSIEELMMGQPEQRIAALTRRFQIIEMRWKNFGTKNQYLYWRTTGNWKPPQELLNLSPRWRGSTPGPVLKVKESQDERPILTLQEMEQIDLEPDENEIQRQLLFNDEQHSLRD
jgi:hypothetical protein